jgi:CARDB
MNSESQPWVCRIGRPARVLLAWPMLPAKGLGARLPGRRNHGTRIVACTLATAAALTLSATAAGAGTIHATSPQVISGLTPLPREGEPGWCGSTIGFQDWESDNALSVNPTDPANLVAAWIQDFSDAIGVGYSIDGGRTWETSLPPTNSCSGGFPPSVYQSALDPWVSFGPSFGPASHGIAYLSSVAAGSEFRTLQAPCQSVFELCADDRWAAVVNRSLDGGRTWSLPRVLDTAALPFYIDGSYVVSDPRRTGRAFAMWAKGDITPTTRSQYVSYTTDGGTSWSPPLPIPSSGTERLQTFGRLLVLPDGTLVDVFGEIPKPPPGPGTPPGVPTTLLATRLENPTEPGSTWSEPKTIAVADTALVTPTAALEPGSSTIYVSWPATDGGSTTLMYAKSSDGGRSWQAPRMLGEAVVRLAADIGGSLAVADDGTVGVAFYDHRNAPPATPRKVTDLWFRHSHDGGASWDEDHLAGPFDQTTAPERDVGDYQGIEPIADGFAATFAAAEPMAGRKTDIFFSRLRLRMPDLQVTNLSTTNNSGVPQGEKVTITATVTNTGNAAAAASTTSFMLDGSTLVGTVAADPIPAGQSRPVSLNWDTRGVKGEHKIMATADSANTVEESNEMNNAQLLKVTIKGNQIRNGSFELSSNGSSPDSWSGSGSTTYENAGSDGARSVSTGPGGSWTSEPVPVEPDVSYDASVVSAGAGGTLLVQQLAADGTLLSSVAQPLLPTSVFALTSLHLTALASATQARLVLLGGLSGKTSFDDVGLFNG